MSNPTLFELAEDMRALEDILDAQEEDASIEDADVIATWLADLDEAAELKVGRCVAVIKTLEARAKVRKEAQDGLSKLVKHDQNAVKRLKGAIIELFDAMDTRRVDTKHYAVTIANNGGKLPLVVDEVPVSDLPAEFVRVVASVDNDAVRSALADGEDLSFARLGERGRGLRIR